MGFIYQELKNIIKNSTVLERRENIEIKQNSGEFVHTKKTFIREKFICQPEKHSLNKGRSQRKSSTQASTKKSKDLKEVLLKETVKQATCCNEDKDFVLGQRKDRKKSKINKSKRMAETWADQLTAGNCCPEIAKERFSFKHQCVSTSPRYSDDKELTARPRKRSVASQMPALKENWQPEEAPADHEIYTKNKDVLNKRHVASKQQATIQCCYSCMQHSLCPFEETAKAVLCHHPDHEPPAPATSHAYTYCQDEYYFDCVNCKAHTDREMPHSGCLPEHKISAAKLRRGNTQCKRYGAVFEKFIENNKKEVEKQMKQIEMKTTKNVFEKAGSLFSKSEVSELVGCFHHYIEEREKLTKLENKHNCDDWCCSAATMKKLVGNNQKPQKTSITTKQQSTDNIRLLPKYSLATSQQYSPPTLAMLKRMKIHAYKPQKPVNKIQQDKPKLEKTNEKQPLDKIKNYQKYVQQFARNEEEIEKSTIKKESTKQPEIKETDETETARKTGEFFNQNDIGTSDIRTHSHPKVPATTSKASECSKGNTLTHTDLSEQMSTYSYHTTSKASERKEGKPSDQLDISLQPNHEKKLKDFNNESKAELVFRNYQMNELKKLEDMKAIQFKDHVIETQFRAGNTETKAEFKSQNYATKEVYKKFEVMNTIQAKDFMDDYAATKDDREENCQYQRNTYDVDNLRDSMEIPQKVHANKFHRPSEIANEEMREYRGGSEIFKFPAESGHTEQFDRYESKKATYYTQNTEQLTSGPISIYKHSKERIFKEVAEYDKERTETFREATKRLHHSTQGRYESRLQEQPDSYEPEKSKNYPPNLAQLTQAQNAIYKPTKEGMFKEGAEMLKEINSTQDDPYNDSKKINEQNNQKQKRICENLAERILRNSNECDKEFIEILSRAEAYEPEEVTHYQNRSEEMKEEQNHIYKSHNLAQGKRASRLKKQPDPCESKKATHNQNSVQEVKQNYKYSRDPSKYDEKRSELLRETKRQTHFTVQDKHEIRLIKEQADPNALKKTSHYHNQFRKDRQPMTHMPKERIFREVNGHDDNAMQLEREESLKKESQISKDQEQLQYLHTPTSREIQCTAAYDVYKRTLHEEYAKEIEREKILNESLDEKLASEYDSSKDIKLGLNSHTEAVEENGFQKAYDQTQIAESLEDMKSTQDENIAENFMDGPGTKSFREQTNRSDFVKAGGTDHQKNIARQHNHHYILNEPEEEQYQDTKELNSCHRFSDARAKRKFSENSREKSFHECQDNNDPNNPIYDKNKGIKRAQMQYTNSETIREGMSNEWQDYDDQGLGEEDEAPKPWRSSIKTSKAKEFGKHKNSFDLQQSQPDYQAPKELNQMEYLTTNHLKEKTVRECPDSGEIKQKPFQISEDLKERVLSQLQKYEHILIRNVEQPGYAAKDPECGRSSDLNPMQYHFFLTEKSLSESQDHNSSRIKKFDKYQQKYHPNYTSNDKNNCEKRSQHEDPKQKLSNGICDEQQNSYSSNKAIRELINQRPSRDLLATPLHREGKSLTAEKPEALQNNNEPKTAKFFESLKPREVVSVNLIRPSNQKPIDDVIKQEADYTYTFNRAGESCPKEETAAGHDLKLEKFYSSNYNVIKKIENDCHRDIKEQTSAKVTAITAELLPPSSHKAKDILSSLKTRLNNAAQTGMAENDCFNSITQAAEDIITKLTSCISLEVKQTLVRAENLPKQIKPRTQNTNGEVQTAYEAQFKDLETSPDSSDVQLKAPVKGEQNLSTCQEESKENAIDVIAQEEVLPLNKKDMTEITALNIRKDFQRESLSEKLPANDYFSTDFYQLETRTEAQQIINTSGQTIITKSNSGSAIATTFDFEHQPMCEECQLETEIDLAHCCSNNSESCFPYTAPMPAFNLCPCMWDTYAEMMLNYYKGRKQYEKF